MYPNVKYMDTDKGGDPIYFIYLKFIFNFNL
jgi:hypothetical protein